MAAWCVYIVKCRDGSLYTGSTNDLDGRLRKHDSGRGAKYTRSRRPVSLVHAEPVRSLRAALRREAEIKSWPRGRKLDLIKE